MTEDIGAPHARPVVDDPAADAATDVGIDDAATSRPAVDRRKVLLALGFTTANVAVLRNLGLADRGTADAAGSGAAGAASGPAATPSTTTSIPPGEPPVLVGAEPAPASSFVHERVIANGRVIDPDSGFDGIAHVGIDGTTITQISLTPLDGRQTIDASGLVVAPGFIDILSYSPNGYGEWAKVADGVTSNIGMHGLDQRAAAWFAQYDAVGSPVHYGGAYDNAFVRPAEENLNPYDTADEGQAARILASAEQDIADGFIGLHLQPEYTPGLTEQELISHGELAARFNVPLCLHIRYSDNLEPGTQTEALDEVLRVAETTGCHVHVEHINSTGGAGMMSQALDLLQGGIDRGLRLTSCTYPYTFWATYLKSARYDGWQDKYGISYGDLQVAGTSSRLDASTYPTAYENNALTAAYAMTDDDIDRSLQADFVMVGSDAILETSHNNHPRSTGCFSRVLGHYVRDRGVIDLKTALSKMTIQPARLLEIGAPAMARKGRMQRGADADITVFDPATVADQSTIADPSIRSTGIAWVLVDGTVVKTPEGVDETVKPGTAIRSVVS